MKRAFSGLRPRFRQRAVALVIVLGMVVIMAALVVTMTVAMRMEQQSAHYYSEQARADMLVGAGVECVKAALLEATATTNTWVTMPGRIIFTSGTGGNFASGTTDNLYSGDASGSALSSNSIFAPPDLNRTVLSDDRTNAIDPSSGAAMPVSWIYLRQDGTYETNETPVFNAANPIIGRFAYWADDESSRVDLSTGWQQTNNTNVSASYPSRVSLTALSGMTSYADQIYQQALPRPYQSPDEARRLGDTNLAAALANDRFFTTHYTHSDNLNPWGEPKIYLTTQLSNLPPGFTNQPNYTSYFLDILNSPNADPASSDNVDPNKYLTQLAHIQQLLQRTNWPYAQGSFASKYGVTNSLQIAMNIIDYVRAAESSNSVMHEIFIDPATSPTNNSISATLNLNNLSVMAGTTRAPCLTEIGVNLGSPVTASGTVTWPVTVKAAFYFPPKYGLNATTFLLGKFVNTRVVWADPVHTTTWVGGNPNANLSAANVDTSKPNFGIVTFTDRVTTTTLTLTNRPTDAYVRVGLLQSQGGGQAKSIEVAAIPDVSSLTTPATVAKMTNATIHVNIDPDGSVAPSSSAKANDPQVNKYSANWSPPSAVGWGSLPTPLVTNAAPPQDTDSGGGISTNSLAMPALKGSASNSLGVVSSVAELGYISSGGRANVPWRTIRLQPNPDQTLIPDWALLDLFAAPILPNGSRTNVIFPQTNSIAGRVNINAAVQPFTNVSRQIALRALFSDPNSATNMAVASNIAIRSLAANGHLYGSSDAYCSIGELAEIQGVASSGEESEQQTLRQIVDLTSVRGDVFRVYSVGQALKQNPTSNGVQFTIQAEKRVVAFIERRPDGSLSVIYWKVIPL